MRLSKKQTNIIVTFLVVAVVTVFAVISVAQIISVRRRNAQLEERKKRLEALITAEQERSEELSEEAIYIQTQKFIEEKAKSIGYVYPDEIIFRKDE